MSELMPSVHLIFAEALISLLGILRAGSDVSLELTNPSLRLQAAQAFCRLHVFHRLEGPIIVFPIAHIDILEHVGYNPHLT